MSLVTITINGKKYQAAETDYVLNIARREGIDIPALCYHEGLAPFGACRLCMVEVVSGGRPGITTSCTLRAAEGLEVITESEEVLQIRKGLLELYLAQAPDAPYIHELAARHGVTSTRFVSPPEEAAEKKKCVLCGLCVRICNEAIGAGVINFIGRGPETIVNTPYLEPSTQCIGCTACADVCPTDVIEISDTDGVRMVATWSKTSVPLKKCRLCGSYCAPSALIDTVYRGVPDLPDELKDVCTKCRRRLKIRTFSQMHR